jgi:predicted DNA-binding transcriptional regulator AlpA
MPRKQTRQRTTAHDAEHDDDPLIGIRELRRLLANCSEMHIWRLLNVERYARLKFPRPTKINSRNYWRRSAIHRWIEDREAASRRAA